MWLEYLRIALGVLRGHAFRSLLTVMSILIGAFSIVLMTSLAESGLSTLSSSFEELGGARLISLWRKAPEMMESKQSSYQRGITRLDVPVLQAIPHVMSVTAFVSLRNKGLYSDSGRRMNGDVWVGRHEREHYEKNGTGPMARAIDHEIRFLPPKPRCRAKRAGRHPGTAKALKESLRSSYRRR